MAHLPESATDVGEETENTALAIEILQEIRNLKLEGSSAGEAISIRDEAGKEFFDGAKLTELGADLLRSCASECSYGSKFFQESYYLLSVCYDLSTEGFEGHCHGFATVGLAYVKEDNTFDSFVEASKSVNLETVISVVNNPEIHEEASHSFISKVVMAQGGEQDTGVGFSSENLGHKPVPFFAPDAGSVGAGLKHQNFHFLRTLSKLEAKLISVEEDKKAFFIKLSTISGGFIHAISLVFNGASWQLNDANKGIIKDLSVPDLLVQIQSQLQLEGNECNLQCVTFFSNPKAADADYCPKGFKYFAGQSTFSPEKQTAFLIAIMNTGDYQTLVQYMKYKDLDFKIEKDGSAFDSALKKKDIKFLKIAMQNDIAQNSVAIGDSLRSDIYNLYLEVSSHPLPDDVFLDIARQYKDFKIFDVANNGNQFVESTRYHPLYDTDVPVLEKNIGVEKGYMANLRKVGLITEGLNNPLISMRDKLTTLVLEKMSSCSSRGDFELGKALHDYINPSDDITPDYFDKMNALELTRFVLLVLNYKDDAKETPEMSSLLSGLTVDMITKAKSTEVGRSADCRDAMQFYRSTTPTSVRSASSSDVDSDSASAGAGSGASSGEHLLLDWS